ncbi:MAG: GNAT family N-acetyltransferase [Candidatus Hodarchaeota archaeon]
MIRVKQNQGEKSLRKKLLQILSAVDRDFLPPLSQRRSLEFWMTLFEKGVILYAVEEDSVAGFLAYYPSLSGEIFNDLQSCVNINPMISSANTHKMFQGAYLHYIAIAPEYRRRKIASALMTELLVDAQRKGISRLRVITWSTNNASLKLYLKHGFSIFNRIANDRGKGVDSVYLEVKIPSLQSPIDKSGINYFHKTTVSGESI